MRELMRESLNSLISKSYPSVNMWYQVENSRHWCLSMGLSVSFHEWSHNNLTKKIHLVFYLTEKKNTLSTQGLKYLNEKKFQASSSLVIRKRLQLGRKKISAKEKIYYSQLQFYSYPRRVGYLMSVSALDLLHKYYQYWSDSLEVPLQASRSPVDPWYL